jgi:hypothetical protein
MPKRFEVCAVAGLVLACASYEQEPLTGPLDEPLGGATTTGGSVDQISTSAGQSGSATVPRGGAGQGLGGAGSSAAGRASGGSPTPPSAGSAGQPTSGAAGSAIAGATGMGIAQSWTFEQGVEGWEVREQSPELTATLVPATGAVRVVDVPFSAAKQFVDVAFTFPDDVDLSGRTLRAVVQRVSGGFVGAQLYVYGGAWGSPGFESLTSGKATTLTVSLDALTAMGVTPGSIARVGVKLQTGSNTANTFGPTTVEITEVAIE